MSNFFEQVGNALFGVSPATDDDFVSDDVNPVSDPVSVPNARADFQYHFNSRPLERNPGVAYHSPLLQFQEYPQNMVEGNGGIHYTKPFEAFQPNFHTTALQPIVSGTSGDIHGQIFYQPLMDTSAQ